MGACVRTFEMASAGRPAAGLSEHSSSPVGENATDELHARVLQLTSDRVNETNSTTNAGWTGGWHDEFLMYTSLEVKRSRQFLSASHGKACVRTFEMASAGRPAAGLSERS